MFPVTPNQMKSRMTDAYRPKLLLVLSKLETGWILNLSRPDGEYALAQSDGVVIRIYRAAKPMNDALSFLGFDKISIPVTSEKLELHQAFLDERSAWLQKQLRAAKQTNQKLADKLNLPNGYISMVINGVMLNKPIEDEISKQLGKTREELFPTIPDQVL